MAESDPRRKYPGRIAFNQRSTRGEMPASDNGKIAAQTAAILITAYGLSARSGTMITARCQPVDDPKSNAAKRDH
jgi:hypothetical protein